jgi:N-methylhydantoinase A/oxoprolinase/acetone carboxylase beta subunit
MATVPPLKTTPSEDYPAPKAIYDALIHRSYDTSAQEVKDFISWWVTRGKLTRDELEQIRSELRSILEEFMKPDGGKFDFLHESTRANVREKIFSVLEWIHVYRSQMEKHFQKWSPMIKSVRERGADNGDDDDDDADDDDDKPAQERDDGPAQERQRTTATMLLQRYQGDVEAAAQMLAKLNF